MSIEQSVFRAGRAALRFTSLRVCAVSPSGNDKALSRRGVLGLLVLSIRQRNAYLSITAYVHAVKQSRSPREVFRFDCRIAGSSNLEGLTGTYVKLPSKQAKPARTVRTYRKATHRLLLRIANNPY